MVGSWKKLIKEVKWGGTEGPRLPLRRLSKEITLKHTGPAMWHRAQMVMWHATYSDWCVLADPNAVPTPAWASWSLNKHGYDVSQIRPKCDAAFGKLQRLWTYSVIRRRSWVFTVRAGNAGSTATRPWLCVTCLLGQMTKKTGLTHAVPGLGPAVI